MNPLTVEFLTQDDPLYILPFFTEFLGHYGSHFRTARVSCCRPMGRRPRLQLARELAWLYGPAGLARLAGRIARAHLLELWPLGNGGASIASLCARYGIPCRKIGTPNDPRFIDGIRERAPDILVSVACPYILKEKLLRIPAMGCVNIHHAPLPRYKGMMPTFWQMYHGERRVGLTIHYMAPRVDEGPALLQEELEVGPDESLDHLIRRSKRHAAHCLARVLRQINGGTVTPTPLNGEGNYFTFPTVQEIREFHRRGLRAI